MTSPKNEWNQIARYNTHTWSEASKWLIRERRYFIPHLIPQAETVWFLADSGVDMETFAALLAFRSAKGLAVEPFAQPQAAPVLVVFGPRGDFEQSMIMLHRIDQACTNGQEPLEDSGHFHFYHAKAEADEATYLDTRAGQEALLQSLPSGCKFVVIPNLAACLSPHKTTHDDGVALASLTEELNRAGIAVAVFEQASSRKSLGSQIVHKSSCLVRLMYDEAAPTELGGGFHLVRQKFDPYDSADVIPTRIQFWFTGLNDKLDWGWTYRDQQNTQSAKQTAIKERRIKVANMLAAKMEQKDIASVLDVHAATICRDTAVIQEQEPVTASADTSTRVDGATDPQAAAVSALEEEWGGAAGHEFAQPDSVAVCPEATLKDLPQPHPQVQHGRGVGNVPVWRDGDESLASELTAIEHERSFFTDSPSRQRPARLDNPRPAFSGQRPLRRRPTRGIGVVPINRQGDESLASEQASLVQHSSEQLTGSKREGEVDTPPAEPPWWDFL